MVDDEALFLELAKSLLLDAGYNADTVLNGAEALEIMRKKPVDAVLLEIMLAGEDGLEVLAAMAHEFPAVPVIIVTAEGYESDLMEATKARGACGYVSKQTSFDDAVIALGCNIDRKWTVSTMAPPRSESRLR